MSTDPTQEQIEEARKVTVFDKEGQSHTFGDLISGKKVAVIFVRHWWCLVCQTYVKKLHQAIPPSSLGDDSSIIIIGCGSISPMEGYKETTQTPYTLYANPTLELYRLFNFTVNLGTSQPDKQKEYEKELGSTANRLWNGFTQNFVKNIGKLGSQGPIKQNGGEVVFAPDGSILYFHRMAHTADHTELKDIAQALNVEATLTGTIEEEEDLSCENGVKV